MFFKCMILLIFTEFLEAQLQLPHQGTPSPSCPLLLLDHGRAQIKQNGRLVAFVCTARYELVGNKYATCKNGQWDVPVPVCVKYGAGCGDLPTPTNAVRIKRHHGAWVVTFCLQGYRLVGTPAIYCDGFKWNATSPSCVKSSAETKLSCDFEEPGMCGWEQDELHDFDWTRANRETTRVAHSGPTYDHTFGPVKLGYYMYIDGSTWIVNDTARLLSPIFDSHLAVNGCFSFFYHMFGQNTGGLRVYQKPDRLQLYDMLNMTDSDKQTYVLFEQWGNQGDFWYSAAPQLTNFEGSFQIVIEGIRGSTSTSDIAIDDVAILQGSNCSRFRVTATSPPPVYSESCEGRCRPASILADLAPGCGCTPACIESTPHCCADFMELCIFGSNNSTNGPYAASSSTNEQTQMKKLIGETTNQYQSTTLPPQTTPLPGPTLTTTERSLTTTELPTLDDLELAGKPSTWKIAVITIIVLAVFASLVFLGIALRTSRGRLALAKLRRRDMATHNVEQLTLSKHR